MLIPNQLKDLIIWLSFMLALTSTIVNFRKKYITPEVFNPEQLVSSQQSESKQWAVKLDVTPLWVLARGWADGPRLKSGPVEVLWKKYKETKMIICFKSAPRRPRGGRAKK